MLLLSGLVLFFNVSGVSAASTGNSTLANHTKTTVASSATVKISFTPSQIGAASSKVKSYYEQNNKLPSYVTINNHKVTMPQFLQLISDDIYQLSNKKTTSITLKNVTAPSKPVENLKTGQLTKTQYINLAKNTRSYIYSTGKAPNNENSSLGTIKFQNLVYSFSKILAFQTANNRLPNYVSVAPFSKSSTSVKISSNALATVDSIGYAEAKYRDVQGQSSASVMEKCGYGDCWADSSWLYNKLSAAGISVRIMSTTSGGIYYLHRWVEINTGYGWQTWDYAKYHSQHYSALGAGHYVVKSSV
ncbi:MAG: pseudomurein-binding protein [Methanobacterium sp.]|nr:pseudomurein-binding protein [Methanobacterium sp.]